MRFKTDWASLIVGSKCNIFALFFFVFEGNFPSTSPRGAYIWRGLFSEFYGMFCVFVLVLHIDVVVYMLYLLIKEKHEKNMTCTHVLEKQNIQAKEVYWGDVCSPPKWKAFSRINTRSTRLCAPSL